LSAYPSPAGGGWPPKAAGCEDALNERGLNRLQHAGEILIDIAIPKTKDAKIPAREIGIACRIAPVMFVVIVLTAIDLDDKAMPETNEIDNEVMPRCLTVKMESTIAPGPNMIPDLHLLRRQRLA
jgi:hypothetical protein